MRTHKPALGFIFITLMLDVLGFGLLIPVSPKLIESLLHGISDPVVAQAKAAPIVAGLQSTFYLMSFLFAPLLGVMSDKWGRRPIILISLLGSGLDYFMMALAPGLGWLFVTRVFNGLSGASFSVASAYVADVTSPEKRAAGFGMIGAAFGLGFVIGPIIGGILGDEHMHLPFIGHGFVRLPFYVAGVLTMINWLYGMFILPESLPADRRAPLRLARANPVGAFASLTRYPLVMGMAIALFLLNMAQFALHATWALSMEHRFEWKPRDIGISLAIVGVCAAVVQGGLARKLIPLLGERRSLMIGLVLGIMAYIGYGAATHGWMIYAIIAVGSIGGIGQPAGQSLITREVHADEQGSIQGALASLNSLAGIIGPLVGGFTFQWFIEHPLVKFPIYMDGANFYASALLAVLGTLAAAWAVRHRGQVRAGAGESTVTTSA